MKNIQIGIIGGTGGIGKWFAHFFQKEGYLGSCLRQKHRSGLSRFGPAMSHHYRQCPYQGHR